MARFEIRKTVWAVDSQWATKAEAMEVWEALQMTDPDFKGQGWSLVDTQPPMPSEIVIDEAW